MLLILSPTDQAIQEETSAAMILLESSDENPKGKSGHLLGGTKIENSSARA